MHNVILLVHEQVGSHYNYRYLPNLVKAFVFSHLANSDVVTGTQIFGNFIR